MIKFHIYSLNLRSYNFNFLYFTTYKITEIYFDKTSPYFLATIAFVVNPLNLEDIKLSGPVQVGKFNLKLFLLHYF